MSDRNKAMAMRIRHEGAAIYATALVLVILACLSWFSLDPLKYHFVQHLSNGGAVSGFIPIALREFGLFGYLGVVLTTVLVVFVLVREIRHKEFSQGVLEGPNLNIYLLLIALLIWFGHAYLVPGHLLGGDASSHIARVAHLRMGLEQGLFISWDNFFYLGGPFLQFTGPLYFWIGGLLDYLVKDPNLTTKIVLFGLHLIGGAALYRFLLEFGMHRFGALLGAVVYAGSFAHLHQILWDGNFPQALTMALLPLSFLFLERVLRSHSHITASWVALTLVSAAQLINHQSMGKNVGAFMIVYALGAFLLRRHSWNRLGPLVTSASLSLLIATFAVVPILAERQWVMMHEHPSLFAWVWPDLQYLKKLLVWNNSYSGQEAYIGITAVALALFGAYKGLRSPKGPQERFFTLIMLISLVLSLGLRGSHVKHIVFVVFFVAVLAGIGAHYVATARQSVSRLPAILMGFLMLDLGSTAIQPLNRTDKGYLDDAGAYLESVAPTERILMTATWHKKGAASHKDIVASIGPGGNPILYYAVQHVVGAHNLTATLTHNYGSVIVKQVEEDLRDDGQLSQQTVKSLRLLNVTRIVNDNGASMDLPDAVQRTVHEGSLGKVIRLEAPYPMIFAPAVATIDGNFSFDKPMLWNETFEKSENSHIKTLQNFIESVLDRMAYDPTTGFAAVILIRDHYSKDLLSQEGPLDWDVKILDYDVSFDRIFLRVQSEADGYMQLSHPWYPTLQVIHNGEKSIPLRSALNFSVFPVNAGINEYHLQISRTDMRLFTGWFSLTIFFLVIIMGVLTWFFRHRVGQTGEDG